MTLPMIVLPRPAPSAERATRSARGSGHDAVPGAADGATDFAELLGAAVLADDRAAPQSSRPSVAAAPAADAPADAPDAETVVPTSAAADPRLTDQAEHSDRDEPSGDRPAAPLPTPAEAVPADIVPTLAATAAAGHKATSATDSTTDPTTGEHFGDDRPPLAGPLAVRPSARPVQTPSPRSPAIDQDVAVDNTEPWAFAVADHPTGGSDRPAGPTLTLPQVAVDPAGAAVATAPDPLVARASVSEAASASDVIDVTAVNDAVDLADTAVRDLHRGELQRIGASRLGIDVATTTLGNIRIEALERGGELQLRLGADQAGARALLTERLPELREHLLAEGVDIGSVDVSSGHDRTRGDRDRQAAPSNLAPADTDGAPGDPAPGTADRALGPSVMSAAGRVDVRI